jgi:hypothetical protein
MTQAWIDYDPQTGELRQVSWKEIDGETLKIDLELAEDFMLGRQSMANYIVVNLHTNPELKKIEHQQPTVRKFWDLATVDDMAESNSPMPWHVDTRTTVYITLKNNPSWLIKTFSIESSDLLNDKLQENGFDDNTLSFYTKK